ncbi:hypothetical protein [Christensenella timonensis]|uniref:hypothetical protein n=1 Tax=Christensenella timonensis TaxID=1816678 RepID=UPI0008358066|nr:hypothetical protein [Christensenella timonensis]
MTIGIKYCGGCNQRYERTEIARNLKRDFPESRIVTAGTGEIDFAVIICGCTSACALHDTIEGRYGKMILTEESGYAPLKGELDRIDKEINQKTD